MSIEAPGSVLLINAHHWNIVWAIWNVTNHISWGNSSWLWSGKFWFPARIFTFSVLQTAYIPEKERYHVTKSQLLAMMDTMMGGRAAEELVFGPDKITSGASSDLQVVLPWDCFVRIRVPALVAVHHVRHFPAGCWTCRVPKYWYIGLQIQDISQRVDITAGGDFLGLCDQKSSYKHVSDFGRLQSYDRLKLRR